MFFLDVERLGSGTFPDKIYKAMGQCDDIIIILNKGCLENCINEEDWMRKEIIKSLEEKEKRNIKIIPIMIDDFDFPEQISSIIDIKIFSYYINDSGKG